MRETLDKFGARFKDIERQLQGQESKDRGLMFKMIREEMLKGEGDPAQAIKRSRQAF